MYYDQWIILPPLCTLLSLIIRCPRPFTHDMFYGFLSGFIFLSWFSILWQSSAKRGVIILWEFPVLGMHMNLWWMACTLFAANQELLPSGLDLLWSSWIWKHTLSQIVLEGIEFIQFWGLGKAPLLNKCGDKWPLEVLMGPDGDSGMHTSGDPLSRPFPSSVNPVCKWTPRSSVSAKLKTGFRLWSETEGFE